MNRSDLKADIFNRLQVCTLALQANIDFPDNPDDVQRRAANTKKQLHIIALELRELLAIDGEPEQSEAAAKCAAIGAE